MFLVCLHCDAVDLLPACLPASYPCLAKMCKTSKSEDTVSARRVCCYSEPMYKRAIDILDLAIRMQAARGGVTIAQIREQLEVSRRTAERLRDAVDALFGLEEVVTEDLRKHWRLRSRRLSPLISVAPQELAELAYAVESLQDAGQTDRAACLQDLEDKLRALAHPHATPDLDAELEALMSAEGHAMRPGPRTQIDEGLIPLLREAIRSNRVVEFRYVAHSTGKTSRQRVEPYGVLYGNRPFLVARTAWANDLRLLRLANMSDSSLTAETFVRDPNFDLQDYAQRSFGTFQERPVQVELRFNASAAQDAATFLFHPSQRTVANEDGSLTVQFRAGGLDEMCWHLFTWGESVTVEKPVRLRKRLAQLCESLASHHGVARP